MNVKYQYIVGVQAQVFFNFIGAVNNSIDAYMKPWLNIWEKWEFLGPKGFVHTNEVMFGDVVTLKNTEFGTFLAVNSGKTKVITEQVSLLSTNANWSITRVSGNKKGNLTTLDEFLLNNGNYFINVTRSGILSEIKLTTYKSKATRFRVIDLTVPQG
jgi:hypothetical protein